jgi:hypothetical protein
VTFESVVVPFIDKTNNKQTKRRESKKNNVGVAEQVGSVTLLLLLVSVAVCYSPSCLPLSGAAALNVLGQPNFTSNTAGTALNQMNVPVSIETDPVTRKIFVVDDYNQRVLRFELFILLSLPFQTHIVFKKKTETNRNRKTIAFSYCLSGSIRRQRLSMATQQWTFSLESLVHWVAPPLNCTNHIS